MGLQRPGSAGTPPQQREPLISSANPPVLDSLDSSSRESSNCLEKHRRRNSVPTSTSSDSSLDLAYSGPVSRERSAAGNHNTDGNRASLAEPGRTRRFRAFVEDDEKEDETYDRDSTVVTKPLINQLENFNCTRTPTPLILTRHRRFASASNNTSISSFDCVRAACRRSLTSENVPNLEAWSTMTIYESETSSEDGTVDNNQSTDPNNSNNSGGAADSESSGVLNEPVWKIDCENKRTERERLISFFKISETRLPPPEIRKVVNFLEWEVNQDILSYRDFEVTELADIELVLRKLSTGEWKCLHVMIAYIKR